MALTEEKLLKWSVQESTSISSEAYHFIKSHLFKLPFVIEHHNNFEAFLQGSYANATNIKNDSDVDIVLKYDNIYQCDNTSLSEREKKEFNEYFNDAQLTFKEYKDTIFTQLKKELSGLSRVRSIEYKPKSIKISLQNPNIDVDVVPCFEYRKYSSFSINDPLNVDNYIEGISFYNTIDNSFIVNYPKQHIKNGECKNNKYNTDGRYKITIRFMKKIKSILVDNYLISEKKVSSYFIENLLYNVPNYCYNNSCMETYKNIVNYLSTAPLNTFICQHKQWKLFGSESTQWNIEDAKLFVRLLNDVKNGYYI